MAQPRVITIVVVGAVLAGAMAFAVARPQTALVVTTAMPSGAASETLRPSVSAATPRPTATAAASTGPSPTPSPTAAPRTCEPDENPDWSVARRWDEALLNAIRRSLPNPPVHARNLFHVSVALWDAWAAFDPTASGYVFHEKFSAKDLEAARAEAMSFAAFRVLKARFKTAVGGDDSLLEFRDVMALLCYRPKLTSREGTSPSAIGNRIADAILARGLQDGSNEAGGYANPGYKPANPPLVIADGGSDMIDPNRWQPLQMEVAVSQNGIGTTNLQTAIGTQWGGVDGFGDLDPDGDRVAIDPGPPPRLGDPLTDALLKEQIVELIRDSSLLDPAVGTRVDISPGAMGGNALGANDGVGHPVNPSTGKPYAAQVVNLADYMRVATQFWADGPSSETPPGHWNVIANDVSDELGDNLRIAGAGAPVGRLEWDVKLYLALNGAVHNAAIAAWGLKGRYDSSRPISLIRYMGGLGQSSDPSRRSYDPSGLLLVPGLIELITATSSEPGHRHERLNDHVGEIAVRAWGPADEEGQGARWILATRWITYQESTFVTPAFAGFVSGHSTFSRAAAEVMAAFTGTEYFPDGSSHYAFEPESLVLESGPTTDVTLEWATYFDAADQAGQSRLFGGIHIQADDFAGRLIGSACGRGAWSLASAYFAGSVPGSPLGCEAD
ncbi:MAG TPA: vanadium-dependent haloperoxidase [Candidatus Limnocylindria bacterium]|nr:vanadium-dependent haloperoxidase [Candidatus Limnocylindria bacterium]